MSISLPQLGVVVEDRHLAVAHFHEPTVQRDVEHRAVGQVHTDLGMTAAKKGA